MCRATRFQKLHVLVRVVVVLGLCTALPAVAEVQTLKVFELLEVHTSEEERLENDLKFWEESVKSDSFLDIDLWAHANSKDKEEVEHVAFTTHPLMISDIFPVHWNRFVDVPLVNVLHEVDESMKTDIQVMHRLMDIFNIKVLTSRNELELPTNAALIANMAMPSKTLQIEIPMRLSEDQAYYLDDPQAFSQEIIFHLSRFQQFNEGEKPIFVLKRLEGIEINADTVENMKPFGIEVATMFRFGSTNVKSEFQWGGRSDEIPWSYPNAPFLVNKPSL